MLKEPVSPASIVYKDHDGKRESAEGEKRGDKNYYWFSAYTNKV